MNMASIKNPKIFGGFSGHRDFGLRIPHNEADGFAAKATSAISSVPARLSLVK
jgi:hypothetical protein